MNCQKNKFELFTDSFDDGLQKWTLCGTAHRGCWETNNGELVYHKAPPYYITRGYIKPRNEFKNIRCIEFDFYMPECDAGDLVIWLHSYHYIASCCIARKSDGSNEATYLRLNSLKHTGIEPMVLHSLTPDQQIRLDDWNNYRLEIVDQTFTLYLNGQPTLVYTDSEYPAEDTSDIQVKITVDGTRFRNFSVQASEILPQQKYTCEHQTPNYYIAQMTMERTRPYGFLEPAGEQNFGMALVNEQPVYGTNIGTEFRHTWLHGFEKNGEVTAEVICTQPTPDAVCGIFARFAVEDSYLRAGYDFKENAWFIAASFGKTYRKQYFSSTSLPDMESDKYYQLRLVYTDCVAQLYVNNKIALVADGLENISYGRMGLFAQGTGFYTRSFTCALLSGSITDGIMEHTVAPDKVHSHFEIERLDQTTLYGQFEDQRYISYDLGEHFVPAPDEYSGTSCNRTYTSIHRRQSDGKFIQVLRDKDFMVQESEDLRNWTTLCHVLPKERVFDDKGRRLAYMHVSTMTELPMPDGTTRIFLPIGFNMYHDNMAPSQYTIVYYSDDGGKTWQSSKKNVCDLPNFSPWHGNMSWCESKIIRCADGRLRMLGTRSMAPCVFYTDSFDNGETWTAYGELSDMPTPICSFGICPDPINPGSYLMVYVNEKPYWHSCIFPRTRLTLVRTDGLTFEKVLDVDRFTNFDTPIENEAELYQILDPAINVFEDYIFITYGRSIDADIRNPHHHGQRARFVRIDRKKSGI